MLKSYMNKLFNKKNKERQGLVRGKKEKEKSPCEKRKTVTQFSEPSFSPKVVKEKPLGGLAKPCDFTNSPKGSLSLFNPPSDFSNIKSIHPLFLMSSTK